eukprot:TRINITY_DN2581_c0_g1_i2.p1 TRINITY_DN2581_c0_g1~~TRINITY_DN2581_c0_g1_i2.p1  ORF type:complete len:141 (+),score=19.93 TRINITY_DN2581_c0_g1_i2:97-519(+)
MISCCSESGADFSTEAVVYEEKTLCQEKGSLAKRALADNVNFAVTKPPETPPTTVFVELEPGRVGMRMSQRNVVAQISTDGTLQKYNKSVQDEAKRIKVRDTLIMVETPAGTVTERSMLIKALASELRSRRPLKLRFQVM